MATVTNVESMAHLFNYLNKTKVELTEAQKEFDFINKKIRRLSCAANNPNRAKIIKILEQEKTPLNIMAIWQRMGGKKGISYKSIYKNIQILKEVGLVKLRKKPKESGQAVMVEYIYPKERIRKLGNELDKLRENNFI